MAITIVLTLGLSISLQSLLAAWVAPSSPAPGGNVNPPINEGVLFQEKEGPLQLAGVATTNQHESLVVRNGRINFGSTGLLNDTFFKLEVSHMDDDPYLIKNYQARFFQTSISDAYLTIGADKDYGRIQSAYYNGGYYMRDLLLQPDGGRAGIGTTSPNPNVAFHIDGSVSAFEYCDATGQNCMTMNEIKAMNADGFFLRSRVTYSGDMAQEAIDLGLGTFGTGLEAANAICLYEANHALGDWKNKPDDISYTQDQVKAWLCGSGACQDLEPNASYQFGVIGNIGVGGYVFDTNANGQGPGFDTPWTACGPDCEEKFGDPGCGYHWTGRRDGDDFYWDVIGGDDCGDWGEGATWPGLMGRSCSNGVERWNLDNAGMRDCQYEYNLICIVEKVSAQQPPPPPTSDNWFLLSENTYNGNLGGLDGADDLCLAEVNSAPDNFINKPNKIYSPSEVRAWLCDNTDCRSLLNNAAYTMGHIGSEATGGWTFFTDADGRGPYDDKDWSQGDAFGIVTPYSHWTGRRDTELGQPVDPQLWPNEASAKDCSNWTTNVAGCTAGSGATGGVTDDEERWRQDESEISCSWFENCDNSYHIICLVEDGGGGGGGTGTYPATCDDGDFIIYDDTNGWECASSTIGPGQLHYFISNTSYDGDMDVNGNGTGRDDMNDFCNADTNRIIGKRYGAALSTNWGIAGATYFNSLYGSGINSVDGYTNESTKVWMYSSAMLNCNDFTWNDSGGAVNCPGDNEGAIGALNLSNPAPPDPIGSLRYYTVFDGVCCHTFWKILCVELPEVGTQPLHYFVSNYTHNGDWDSLPLGANDGNGTEEMSAACNQDSNRILGRTYGVALLTNWGIGGADYNNGIYGSGINGTDLYINNSTKFWTNGWLENCNNWSQGTNPSMAPEGGDGAINGTWTIGQTSYGGADCDESLPILCIEIP
ncbi:hypothetical protein ACFLZ9_00040 [Patescibacteria group bacterium]